MVRRRRIPRPFLKWVGGKSQLLKELLKRRPAEYGAYHEPFVGGGALFFEMAPATAHLSDTNAELINCYKVIRRSLPRLVQLLKSYPYDKEFFYEIRARDPETLDPIERAARTIYLNKSGYNGLYRVNSDGLFNVPFGRHVNPIICDETNLKAVSQVLMGAHLRVEDFGCVLERASAGDFVYFDPPYYPLSQTSYFTDYTRDGFGHAEQERLAALFDALHEKGVRVLLSNSDHPEVRKLYGGKRYRIDEVLANRHVNSKASGRGRISELLIRNYKQSGELCG